jgi:hypothetical protein
LLGFNSARNRKVSAILADLRGTRGALLDLSLRDIDIASSRHNLPAGARPHLLKSLIAEAITCDVDRLIALFRASGRTTMPPARLVADWALSLGADTRDIATLAVKSAAPIMLAREYLTVGRIDAAERNVLEDVAAAYGAVPDAALIWIEAAVAAEIDTYIARSRPRASSWQRTTGDAS